MMIQLEEVAQTIRTETHNIVDQKLTFHQGREFYIPVDVSSATGLNIQEINLFFSALLRTICYH